MARPCPAATPRLWFLEQGGREASVTDPENLLNAVRGRAGIHILKDE